MSGHGDSNKRSPSKVHRSLAARFSPSYPGENPTPTAGGGVGDPAGGSPNPPKTTTPAQSSTSVVTPPKSTTPTTTTTSTSTTTSSSVSTGTTTTSSSSGTSTTQSILSTPTPILPTAPQVLPTTSIQVPTGMSLANTPTLTPSATPSSTNSSGSMNTSAIVGGIAGGLAGIAILGFLIMWCMRRQRNRDDDEFDASAFRRQSAILVDDPVEQPRSYNNRAPAMIERHVTNASSAQAGYGGQQNFYGGYGGYGQQGGYAPGEMIQHGGSPPPHAYGQPPMGYAGYNGPSQLARQPSSAAYLNRQPSAAAAYGAPPAPLDPGAHYVDLSRSSVTPFQAAQYADISRHLNTINPNMHASQPDDLDDTPLPSPFDNVPAPPAAHLSPAPGTAISSTEPAVATPQARQNTSTNKQRPVSSYTVYEEGDAYGGI
ncbi:hypothetical protein HYDPIDRAFT_27447 [Hydnomerulius pinastri MD-312]|nr:hypothetical protein HYDPIDRAFT_27447 [Hydnomerulius pinastri MD-312]